MEEENTLNPETSLQIITRAIEASRKNFSNQSFYFLLWGWLVSSAALGHYLLSAFTEIAHPYYIWPILMGLGVIWVIVYSMNKRSESRTESVVDAFLKYLWIVIGISCFFVVFLSFRLNIHPSILTLLLAGIGTTISGYVMKFRPFIIGGLLFFVFCTFCLYSSMQNILLINALAIFMGYIIPAYMLKASYKK